MEPTDLDVFKTDVSACFLALANALEARYVLTKAELSAAAQERLLVLRETLPKGSADKLVLLRRLAMELEQKPAD